MIPALSGAPATGVRVLIATRPVDFRRGADSLAVMVQSVLRQDPFGGTVFVFRSKRADRVKMLVYGKRCAASTRGALDRQWRASTGASGWCGVV
jgi:transposase